MSNFYIFILIAAVFISSGTKAQTAKIDSLENLLQKHTIEDTVRVNLLNDIAFKLLRISDQTIDYSNEAGELADKINFKNGKARSLHLTARYYKIKNDFHQAMDYYQQALIIYEEIENKMQFARTLRNIGFLYWKQNNYPKAHEFYLRSLTIYKELGKEQETSNIYNYIGAIYEEEDNYPKALEYYQKSLKCSEKTGNKNGISIGLSNVGIIYQKQGNYPKAHEFYQKAMKIDNERGSKKRILIDWNNIGEIHKMQGDYTKALGFFLEALDMAKDIRDEAYITCVLCYNISDVCIQMKKYDKALDYNNKSLKIANKLDLLNNQRKIYKQLSEIYAATKNYKKAYQNHLIYEELNDSMFSKKNIREITSLELQYKYEKEKQFIESEQQKKDVLYEKELQLHKTTVHAFILISVLITFITLLVIYSLFRKRKANRILAEQKNEIQIKNDKISEQNNALTDTLKQLEEAKMQLVQSEKMASIGVLAAGIAHEINNPVNFILGGLNNLKRDFHDIRQVINRAGKIDFETGNAKDIIQYIRKLKIEYGFDEAYKSLPEIFRDVKLGAERIADIVKSLGSFTRMNDGETHLFNIHEGIENSLILLRNKYKDNIEIIKHFDNNIPEIYCNPNKTNQISMNLLSNAMDAISGKGKIYITTKLLADKISISIKDTGPGISKELQSKIFDPFYTNKPEGKGMGLGLYIVYGFIKDHNGSIEVISEIGKGSEFIVSLPTNRDK